MKIRRERMNESKAKAEATVRTVKNNFHYG